jgi:UDP-N-acetylmuramoyl-tripeptide--D-alanyl-D-alanine ligase
MKPLADMIAPDVAIITVVAAAHTLQLGGLAGVAREKSLLPRGLAPGGVAIFPKSCTKFDAFQNLFVDQLVLERSAAPRAGNVPRHSIDYNVARVLRKRCFQSATARMPRGFSA